MQPLAYPYTRRVLVVEQDPGTISALKTAILALESEAEIIVVDTVEDAMKRVLYTRMVGLPPFDLVIADSCIQGPKSGLDLWRWCRQARNSIPFLFVSGINPAEFYPNLPNPDEQYHYPPVQVIRRPIDISDLSNILWDLNLTSSKPNQKEFDPVLS